MTPLLAACLFVAVPGKAAEPETVLLNNKVLVCDAEGCLELVAEDTEEPSSTGSPIINTPELKPESQTEIESESDSGPEPGPIPDLPVVETSVDETVASASKGNDEPDDRGAQWMMGFGVLGLLSLAGFGFWTMARKRDSEAADEATADETGATDEPQDGALLSIRNIKILDDRFSKFEIEIANTGQNPASSVRIDARIIVHRLEADPGDASVTAEKSATEIMRAIPGAAAENATLGIFLYRDMFKDRTDQTAYDVEVNGTIHWTDPSGENREQFAFCAPAITDGSFNGEVEKTGFAMLPGPILDHYAESVS